MNKCSVILTRNDSLILEFTLGLSKPIKELKRYYRGKGNSPDISTLVNYLLDDIIPSYFGTDFTTNDLVDFLNDRINAGYLITALQGNFSSALILDPQYLQESPSYVDDVNSLIRTLREEAMRRSIAQQKGEEQKQDELQRDEEELDTSAEGLPTIEEAQRIWGTDYADITSYRAARFKDSIAMESLMYSTFVNKGFVSNVYINTDTNNIVNQTQAPGKQSEIDSNLKSYRLSLLEKLLNKFDIYENVGGTPTKIVYSDALGDRLNSILPLLENKVLNVKRNDKDLYLLNDGVLSTLFDDYSKAKSPELKAIIDNYVDYLMLADFDMLLKFYIPNTLYIDYNNGDFDKTTRKYSIKPIFASDAYNSTWEDKVQNGVELASDIYKMVIEATPILSYVSGEDTNENLYPSAISHAFAPLFNSIDRADPINSIRTALINEISRLDNSVSNKDILYTIYKKFFELPGDNLSLPGSNTNESISSFLNTIKSSGVHDMHPLMLLIIKPLQEVAKVIYAETVDVGRKLRLNLSSSKRRVHSTINLIDNNLNKSKEEMDTLFEKYNIRFNNNTFFFKHPISEQTYSIASNPSKSNYDLGFLTDLSLDLLGLDFEHNKGHKEFFDTLRMLSRKANSVEPVYLRFLFDALQIANAKNLLYQPKIIAEIKDKGRTAVTANNFLNKLIVSGGITNTDRPENTILKLNTSNSNEVVNILEDSQNRYTGNRLKSTIYTVEGTTVAAFSVYNYFLGFNQNLSKNLAKLDSVAGKDNHIFSRNILFTDNSLLANFYVRGAAKIGSNIKSNSKQLTLETASYDINAAYFGEIARAIESDFEPTPAFDITVYSDKTTNFLPAINNIFTRRNNAKVNLFTKRDGNATTAVDYNVVADLLYENNRQYYRTYGQNIIDDWARIYEAAGFPIEDLSELTVSQALKRFNEQNENFWKNQTFEFGLTGMDAVRFYANKAGVEIVNWVHFQNNAKELNGSEFLGVKEDLIKEIELVEKGKENFKAQYNKHLIDYVNNLRDINFKFHPSVMTTLETLYPDLSPTGRMRPTFVQGSEHSISAIGVNKIKSIADIHPAIVKYFYDYNLIAASVMQATLGPIYAHKGKTPAQMLITQLKRNVAAPASVRLYSLGLLNGVEDSTNVAFVDDFQTKLKTILSPSENVVSFDGSSFSTYTHRIKTWNSLNKEYGNDGGMDHKSFISDFDPIKGIFKETKHAEFTFTNDLIRRSIGTEFDLYEFHRELYKGDVSKVDITKSFDKDLSNFGDVYYYDEDKAEIDTSGVIYRLESITYQGPVNGTSTYKVIRTDISTGVKETSIIPIATFFDIWNVLGSYKSVELSDSKTSITVDGKRGPLYFKRSHTAAERLLDFEVYMGNENEYIVNEDYIRANYNTDRSAYAIYKRLFKTNGIVNSHLDLINRIVEGEQITAEELYNYDIQDDMLDPELFTEFVLDNASSLRKVQDMVVNKDGFKLPTRKYQRFKGLNIDRVSTAGAQKVGQYFLNGNSTYLLSKRETKYKTLNESAKIKRVQNAITADYDSFLANLEANGIITRTNC